MAEEILINVTPQEARVALVENGVLQEVFVERANRHGIVGNIYQGKVVRVLPGMQAAFVDIGLERTAFLHVADILRPTKGNEDSTTEPLIRDLLHESQQIIVQVVKDPLGTKGARLTMHLTLPSRYLVYMPYAAHVGISNRIEDDQLRTQLREAVTAVMQDGEPGGYVVRTAAEGVPPEALRADMLFLQRLWALIQERIQSASAPALVHGDLPLVLRILRDLLRDEVQRVRVDSGEAHRQVVQFAHSFFPHLEARIEHYTGERPIFDIYSVEDEILRALQRKVQLKSGGHLVIDQTEAMTTIDVNTGGYVGHRNLEETIFKTNLEAAQTLSRQLRLRNLGGIIIVDFIDMLEPSHRDQVLSALARHMQKDHARHQIFAMSPLGLVEMTRKRTRESLEHILCEPCPHCSGHGAIRTVETIGYEIFREIVRASGQFQPQQIMVLAAPQVIEKLMDEESAALADLESHVGRPIRLQAESQYGQEQYDVVPL